MVDDSSIRRGPRRSDRVRDARSVKKFIEELSWVLSSYSHLDFRALPHLLTVSDHIGGRSSRQLTRHVSDNPNIHFLVGALPIIFTDERLFPSNADIAEFAQDALNLPISRWEKRSKYELIGLIACETARLDDRRLDRLVGVLSRLVAGEPAARKAFSEKQERRLSWSEMIQSLSRGFDDEE